MSISGVGIIYNNTVFKFYHFQKVGDNRYFIPFPFKATQNIIKTGI